MNWVAGRCCDGLRWFESEVLDGGFGEGDAEILSDVWEVVVDESMD